MFYQNLTLMEVDNGTLQNITPFRIGNPFKGESIIKTKSAEKADLEKQRIEADRIKTLTDKALVETQIKSVAEQKLAETATEKAKSDNQALITIVIALLVVAAIGGGLWFYLKKK